MDWLTFTSKLIESLAWPLGVAVIALAYRAKIVERLPDLKHVKAGPFEAAFERAVVAVGAKVEAITPDVQPPEPQAPERQPPEPQLPEPQLPEPQPPEPEQRGNGIDGVMIDGKTGLYEIWQMKHRARNATFEASVLERWMARSRDRTEKRPSAKMLAAWNRIEDLLDILVLRYKGDFTTRLDRRIELLVDKGVIPEKLGATIVQLSSLKVTVETNNGFEPGDEATESYVASAARVASALDSIVKSVLGFKVHPESDPESDDSGIAPSAASDAS